MPSYLSQDISYCQLDGHLFFLDVGKDRYFQLPKMLEQRFINHVSTKNSAGISDFPSYLQEMLWPAEVATVNKQRKQLPVAVRSVLEAPGNSGKASPSMILEVFIAVLVTRRQLKQHRLKFVLDELSEYRSTSTVATASNCDECHLDQDVARAAAVFNRVRLYVPIETRCLLDSLSMLRYLSRLGFPASLVMGVACDPFSAHAWVQCGECVLNDTVGNVGVYTPIRVI